MSPTTDSSSAAGRILSLVVMDSDTGKIVASVPIPGDVDDLSFDARRGRIYASCGEGAIAVIRQVDADRYESLATIPTVAGARTSIFSPDSRTTLPRGTASGGSAGSGKPGGLGLSGPAVSAIVPEGHSHARLTRTGEAGSRPSFPEQEVGFMWIVRLALRRTYTFVVVALLIAVLGAVSIYRMSTDIFPNIDIPVVSVVWQYTGMPADEIETRIIFVNERVLTDLGQRHRAHREPVARSASASSASTSSRGPRSRRPRPR